jgi:hypothetical protein
MTSVISQIKAELDRINEARAKATQGKWLYCPSVWIGFIGRHFFEVYTPPFEDKTEGTLIAGSKVELEDAQFIALAANEITNLTKALSVAVERLNNQDCPIGSEYFDGEIRVIEYCPVCDTLKTIAEILSGGGEKK